MRRRILPPSSWIAHEQAAHLPRVVGQASQAAPGDHARARGRRGGRALDIHLQPWAVDPRPTRRTLARGRFRGIRVRQGRLDTDGCVRVGPGGTSRQRGVRSRAVRRRARHPPHVHPPRAWCEAADRHARTDLRPLRPGHEPGGGSRDQPEAPQGDRERGSPRPGRGAVVAALANPAQRGRTVGGEPPAHLAGPRRWPECERPGLAGGRHPVGPLLERGREGAPGSCRHLLLLEGRAPSAPECPATRGHRRDHGGDCRPRDRLLDDTVGSRPRAERPDRRRLPSSRSLRPPGAGRRERGGARPAHRAAPPGVEVGRERVLSAYDAKVAQTTHVCTAQLPAFPPLDSRPVAIQPVPASVGRLVERNVLVAEPVITPPPPIARLPAGQSCCWLFGLLLLDTPLPEINCSPDAPGGPCGPAGPGGPAGIWLAAKSTAWSEAFFTFAELTALFFNWRAPTLLRGSAVETA